MPTSFVCYYCSYETTKFDLSILILLIKTQALVSETFSYFALSDILWHCSPPPLPSPMVTISSALFFSSFFNPFLNSFLLLYLQWSSFKVHISTLLFSLYSVSDTAYNYHISFSLFVVDNNVVFINSWPFLKLCVHISNALLNMINGICCHPIKLNVSKQTLLQWVLPPLNLIMYYQSSSPQGLKPWCYLFNFLLFIVPKPPVHQYSRDVNNSF